MAFTPSLYHLNDLTDIALFKEPNFSTKIKCEMGGKRIPLKPHVKQRALSHYFSEFHLPLFKSSNTTGFYLQTCLYCPIDSISQGSITIINTLHILTFVPQNFNMTFSHVIMHRSIRLMLCIQGSINPKITKLQASSLTFFSLDSTMP